jgi:hypothetical protein
MSEPSPLPSIVVAGDATADWFQVQMPPQQASQPGGDDQRTSWQRRTGTLTFVQQGGSLLQARLVAAAVGRPVKTHLAEWEHDPGAESNLLRSYADLGPFRSVKGGKAKDTVYRVARFGGFAPPPAGAVRCLPVADDDPKATIVVLDDAGNGYRDCPEVWPAAIREPGMQPLVILKMHGSLFQGPLWEHLLRHHGERLSAVVSPDDLREAGVNLCRGLSWERTAMDFAWHMLAHPMLLGLTRCAHVIVRLGLDGAIDYQPGATAEQRIALHYDPARIEGGFAGEHEGEMVGITSAFVAGIVAGAASPGGLASGIDRGLQAGRCLLKNGFGANPGKLDERTLFAAADASDPVFQRLSVPTDAKTVASPEKWTILREKASLGFEEVAYQIVREGDGKALRGIPVGCFGRFKTVDRAEIEGFRAVRNLLSEYIRDRAARMPLSIAVFGPPGSGKSFGVSEVAKAVGGDDVEKIEFNVSQFGSPEDLVRAFHRVRDLVLEGKVPLVFFDEFDSSFGSESLGWLKRFLAPMQDGKFKDGDATHPIGKAIFVFAGGTSFTFRQFSRQDETNSEATDEFARRKGPDFVSRLRGFIDIAELNPGNAGGDVTMLRRAILLRSMIEYKPRCKAILDGKTVRIDPGVLRAFIKVPVFKHRARSMEAIIDMSMLAGRRQFEQSSLPPREQLELHVDADAFLRLVARDVLFGSTREDLGRAAHACFLDNQRGKRAETDDSMRPWEELREELKESNRKQADDIPNKLRAVSCGFETMPSGEQTGQFEFTEAEIKVMARLEHDRWNQERLREGWRLGPKKNNNDRITPYLVPFDDLDAETQQWDVEAVRAIPDLVRRAGFRIYSLKRA